MEQKEGWFDDEGWQIDDPSDPGAWWFPEKAAAGKPVVVGREQSWSLQEWQAAHEKIFRAMDPDRDGTITFEEMMNFMWSGRSGARPSQPR